MKKYVLNATIVAALIGFSGCSMSSLNPFSGSDDKKVYSSGIAGVDGAYNEYRALEANKAMAVAIGSDKRFAVGHAFEYASQEKANAEAIARCNASNSKAKQKVDAECKLYAVGNEIVYK